DGVYATLDPPEVHFSLLLGINNLGGIVGAASDVGFRYGHGVFKPLKFPGASVTEPFGLNDNGAIVGFIAIESSSSCFAFVKTTFYRVRFPGAQNVMVCLGINNSGQIVGQYGDVNHASRGFLITPGN